MSSFSDDPDIAVRQLIEVLDLIARALQRIATSLEQTPKQVACPPVEKEWLDGPERWEDKTEGGL